MAFRSEKNKSPEHSDEAQSYEEPHSASAGLKQRDQRRFKIFCPNCRNTLITPHLLEICGHVLCKECYEKALSTDCTTVTCPFHCQHQMLTDHVSKMASGQVYSINDFHDDEDDDQMDAAVFPEKEPVLVKFVQPDVWESSEVGRRQNSSKIEEAIGKRKISRGDDSKGNVPVCATNPSRASQQRSAEAKMEFESTPCKGGNVTSHNVTASTSTLTYSPEHSKDYWLSPVKLYAGIDKDVFLQGICEAITTKENYIMGWYACNRRDKIVIDINQGDEYVQKTNAFLTKTFTNIDLWEKNFVIEEQEYEAEEIVGTAAKIVDELKNGINRLFVDNNSTLPPDSLTQEYGYGTVTCLAETDSEELYALTSKHVFSDRSDQPSEIDTKIYASVNNSVREIGRYYRGLKGTIQLDDNNEALPLDTRINNNIMNRAVDIAAVPISEDIKNRLDRSMMNNMSPCISGVNDAVLNGVEVTKHGAASGTTKGEVILTNYFGNRDNLVRSGYQMVVPNRYFTSFATNGDSGSLVCGVDGTPIGIVIESWKYKHMGQLKNATVVVLLDNCLKALKKCDITIRQCKLYCARPPIDLGIQPGI